MKFPMSKFFNCLDAFMTRRFFKKLLESGRSGGLFAEKGSSASEQAAITGL